MDEEQREWITADERLSILGRLPDRLRLPLLFDPAALQEDLARLSNANWTPHFVRHNYEGDWSALPLRAPANATHPILKIAPHPGTTAWESTQWLAQSPHFGAVLDQLHCTIGAVRLMRLTPGSTIREHCDGGLAAELGSARLHVPIVTDERAEFLLNGVPVPMAPGELWYLRLADAHSATNRGLSDRVHLVIDIDVNDWFESLLEEGMRIG